MKSLAILFSGEECTATFRDGTLAKVFVRILPERYLLDQFLTVMSAGSPTIELCTYTKAGEGEAPLGAHPEVPTPAGYWPVPVNWADNLSDESVTLLYEKAKELNFPRAAKLAEARLAAKQQVASLHQMAVQQVIPLVLQVIDPLMKRLEASFASMRSAPSSSSAEGSSS